MTLTPGNGTSMDGRLVQYIARPNWDQKDQTDFEKWRCVYNRLSHKHIVTWLDFYQVWTIFLTHPFKRCSASRIKPHETFELAKKRQNILCFGVLQFCSRNGSFRHGEVKIWLFVFLTCYKIHWNWFCGRKQTKNAKIRKGAFLFAKGALTGKSIFQEQQINAVYGRCFSSSVLRDIPSNFTRSVRRRISL